ncbi:hypothetical protein V1460_35130 [Streptomyces sp. SCSIO 30461]|uniref:hypothetical protein n=1 Tax=Streptomyces sp. SCSIO 30461 TaxID=3118085 RepID=UPI0030CB2D25
MPGTGNVETAGGTMGEFLDAAVGFPSHLLSMALLLVAPLLSWLVTRRLVRPLARLLPDESGRSQSGVPGLSGPLERDRSATRGKRRAAAPVRRGR